MQLRDHGRTISFDSEVVPTREGFKITVSPRSPGNVVLIHYRVNGGGPNTIRAYEIPALWSADEQVFRAVFPKLPPGSFVEYLPTCQSGGPQMPPSSVRDLPASFRVPDAAPPALVDSAPSETKAAQRQRFNIEYLATFSVLVREPEIIGETPEGLKVNWWVKSGSFDGPRLRGIIRPEGADWMTIRPDGIGVLEVRATLETHDAALISASYAGVFELGENGYERFLAGKYPKFPQARTTPRYTTADPRYKWLNRLQCIAAGAVDMDKLNFVYESYAFR